MHLHMNMTHYIHEQYDLLTKLPPKIQLRRLRTMKPLAYRSTCMHLSRPISCPNEIIVYYVSGSTVYEGSAPDMPPQHFTPGSANDNYKRIISVVVTDAKGWIGAVNVTIVVRTFTTL